MALNKKYVDQVTPKQIIKNFVESGVAVTVEEANQILEFMYMLAEIALDIAEEELKKEKPGGSNSNGFKDPVQ